MPKVVGSKVGYQFIEIVICFSVLSYEVSLTVSDVPHYYCAHSYFLEQLIWITSFASSAQG
jgi:hypothetical protein